MQHVFLNFTCGSRSEHTIYQQVQVRSPIRKWEEKTCLIRIFKKFLNLTYNMENQFKVTALFLTQKHSSEEDYMVRGQKICSARILHRGFWGGGCSPFFLNNWFKVTTLINTLSTHKPMPKGKEICFEKKNWID